jgi:ribosomal protein L23
VAITELTATKPEIKQYIEKVYGLNVLRVNTLVQMGKLKTGANRSRLE